MANRGKKSAISEGEAANSRLPVSPFGESGEEVGRTYGLKRGQLKIEGDEKL